MSKEEQLIKYCVHCGAKADKNKTYCPKCGKLIINLKYDFEIFIFFNLEISFIIIKI